MSKHWCWWVTPGGANSARKDFLDMRSRHPDAYAKSVVTIGRLLDDTARSGIKTLRGNLREVIAQDGAVFLRTYYFTHGSHHVGVFVDLKKKNKANQDDVNRYFAIAKSWQEIECQGQFTFPV